MCGIVGYVGRRDACPILIKGLHRLEYRGYDSAGVALVNPDGRLNVFKCKGKVSDLEHFLDGKDLGGNIGIAHTRWATHGVPNDANAHPHYSESENIALIHNGIIENYRVLKDALEQNGYTFRSSTDSEVLVNLIEYVRATSGCSLPEAVRQALRQVIGAYAIAVVEKGNHDRIVAARQSSPMVVGVGDGEFFLSSDAASIIEYTEDFVYVGDGEIAVIDRNAPLKIVTLDNHDAKIDIKKLQLSISQLEKGGYPHFMLKEIYEQPAAVRDTISPRLKDGQIDLSELALDEEAIRNVHRLYIIGCGSAYHVGMAARYVFESLARIPVEVDVASEFRYRNPVLEKDALAMVISQSGETADTLAALRLCKERGVRTIGIVNVVGSSIAREADATMYTWAGPEISVATTKAYSTQLAACYLLAVEFARVRGKIEEEKYAELVAELQILPDKIAKTLTDNERIQWFASKYASAKDAFFIGRGLDYAVALEGSLKFKEISYIHSEAFAAGEMKHGPISLIEKNMLVVGVLTQPDLYEKMVSNLVEAKSRGAYIMGLTTYGNYSIEDTANFTVYVPKTDPHFATSLSVVPLQLLAYYVSCAKGLDVDKPRNLAKSVTVE